MKNKKIAPLKPANETKTPKEVSFTPGPWNVVQQFTDGWRIEPSIAWIGDGTSRTWGEHKKNATLIAAAPELYRACRALQAEAAARGCGLRIADEALAKADGVINKGVP